MTIAVDFDGTIVAHAYPAIGRELPGAIATLRRLQADGHRLILWTVREGELLDAAVDFCRARGLEFHAVNEHYADEPLPAADHFPGGSPDRPARPRKACRKLTADLYIDDRNLGGFPGWEAIYAMVSRRQSFPAYLQELATTTRPPKKTFLQKLFH